jgi:hypothetical protein
VHEYGVTLQRFDDLPRADAVVAAVAHREYKGLIDRGPGTQAGQGWRLHRCEGGVLTRAGALRAVRHLLSAPGGGPGAAPRADDAAVRAPVGLPPRLGSFVGGPGDLLPSACSRRWWLADGIAPYADAVFDAGGRRCLPRTAEAWLGALAYTLQLYFDFSGYSDMAIGLSWMFNIRLPFNFDSPYKATSISDFWRRWHISLSTFLRDYLYVPLGWQPQGRPCAAT